MNKTPAQRCLTSWLRGGLKRKEDNPMTAPFDTPNIADPQPNRKDAPGRTGRPSFVYVAGEDEFTEFVKIGRSFNPKQRVAAFNTAHNGAKPMRILAEELISTVPDAERIQNAVLQRLALAGVRVNGECAYCKPCVACGIMVMLAKEYRDRQLGYDQLSLFGDAA